MSLMVLLSLGGCQPSQENDSAQGPKRLRVLATTLMIADAVQQIAGDEVELQYLMGPGVDPHLYQPTANDRIKLQKADLILYHGHHLEGKMVETFEAINQRGGKAVAVSRDIAEDRLLSWEGGLKDPHVWHDVELWKCCVQTIADILIELQSESASQFRERAAAYTTELEQTHEYCLNRAAEVPESQRWLITSHDAFHYYGKAYGFQVVGIQGISTESEAGLKKITDAVDLIKSHNIKAIFPETSVSAAAIERVAQDSKTALGPELYSDALGGVDSGAETYIGMIKANTDSIVDGLTGKLTASK